MKMGYGMLAGIGLALFTKVLLAAPTLDDKIQSFQMQPISNIVQLFPVNVLDKKINLSVTIPSSFKILKNREGTPFLEFIPVSDKDPYNWSEIITTMPVIGKSIQAKAMVESIAAGISEKSTDFKVLKTESTSENDYTEYYKVVMYNNKGRIELLKIYSASGPYDLAMVQYAIYLGRAGSDITKNQIAAQKKIETYFVDNVKIITDPK